MKYEQNFQNSMAQLAGKTPCQYLHALGTHLIASFFELVANSFKFVALEDCDELTPFFKSCVISSLLGYLLQLVNNTKMALVSSFDH